jgi:hypothetical protein
VAARCGLTPMSGVRGLSGSGNRVAMTAAFDPIQTFDPPNLHLLTPKLIHTRERIGIEHPRSLGDNFERFNLYGQRPVLS